MALRYLLGKKFARLLLKTGKVDRLVKKIEQEDRMLSLCFHAPDRHLFEACVSWLAGKGFQFISVHDLEAIIDGQQPFPRKAVVITVDDGWQSNLDNIASVALKYQVSVEIFISTEMVESGAGYWWSYVIKARQSGLVKEQVEYFKSIDNDDRVNMIADLQQKIKLNREALTVNQVKEISDNPHITVGSHTISHPILPRCRNEQSKAEIHQSKQILENWIGKEVRHFAYPNGDYTNREISFLKKAGYSIAFTTEQCYLTPGHLAKRYQLPRFMMVESASIEENICRMVGAWPLKAKKRKVVFP